MGKKYKIGIVGMGYIGESHLEALRRIELCEIEAIADINYKLAQEKAEKFGIAKVYTSIDKLLDDPNIDVVHNCTPNNLHYQINKQIILRGKHLFTEKPLCRNYSEAEKLAAIAKSSPNVKVGVNYNYRLNPMVQEMKARIQCGELGQLRIISGSYQQDWLLYDTDYSWRLDREISGISCAIADIGSHFMDIVQHVSGDTITDVFADLNTFIPTRKRPKKQTETFSNASGEYEEIKVENEEYGAVLFKTENGARGCYHVSELAAGRGCYFNFELNGSKTSMRWNQEENDRLWIGRRDGDSSLIVRNPNAMSTQARQYTGLAMGHPEGWNDAFKGNIYSFYKHLSNGEKAPFATLEEAAYIVKLTEAIVESSQKQCWIKIRR